MKCRNNRINSVLVPNILTSFDLKQFFIIIILFGFPICDFERTWKGLFQKEVVHTNLDIYNFIDNDFIFYKMIFFLENKITKYKYMR